VTHSDLRVLHIGSGRYQPGDRSHTSYGIWKELASGFAAYHVVARSSGESAQWRDRNLTVTLLRSWSGREAEFLLTQFLIGREVRAARPDVIVCQSPVAGGLAAGLAARATGARLLMELHGAEFFRRPPSSWRVWLLQMLARKSLSKAHRIRVLSERMREQLVAVYGTYLADRIRLLQPRVELSRFSKDRAQPSRHGPLQVAILGTVNANKGQLRLIQAIQSATFPIELHVIGDGPDLAACKAKATQLKDRGSPVRVECHGRVGHSTVADILQSCDVLVMYSQTEATPRAMIEAMAAGLAVVTTNVGFCADLLEDNVEGIVLGREPDAEILAVLSRFSADRSFVARMGAAAEARARNDYDSIRLFEEYRRLIVETANR
jgi:glycosyltransferase involved in cell wall biosynthesis